MMGQGVGETQQAKGIDMGQYAGRRMKKDMGKRFDNIRGGTTWQDLG